MHKLLKYQDSVMIASVLALAIAAHLPFIFPVHGPVIAFTLLMVPLFAIALLFIADARKVKGGRR